MNKLTNFLKKHWLILTCIILFFLKLWLVHIQPLYIKDQDHDDAMFVKIAYSILNGGWLGTYDDITLSKGVVGILFLVVSNILNISYLTSLQIVYFLACLSVIYMLNYVIKNKKILLIIFLILLFNPISYSDAFSFVYRDGLYTSLILFFISFSLLLFFNYSNLKKVVIYSILFGLTITAIYLCREENIWLLPYIIVASIILILFILKDKKCKHKYKKILCISIIPFAIFLSANITIASINYKYYGRFVVNDFYSKDFKDAYGALTRIKQENYIERVPLNEETRNILYHLSPKFKEIQPYLEGEKTNKYKKINGDIQDGHFYWALRIAVKEAGYYSDAQSAKEYYIDLANEINTLCDTNQLDCLPKRSSVVAPYYKVYNDNLITYIPEAFKVQANYKYVNVVIPIVKDNISVFTYYADITNNKLFYSDSDLNSLNMKIMNILLAIYAAVNPILMAISIICYLLLMILFFAYKTYTSDYKKIIILNGLLSLYLIRVVMIGYIAATEYTSAIRKCQYLACSYPIQSVFSILAILFVASILKNKVKRRLKARNN